MTLLGFLAALSIELPKQDRRFGRGSNLLVSDLLLILGVGVALLLVLTLIAYLWVKSRRTKRRRHISGGEKVYRGSPHSDSESDETEEDEGDDQPPDSDDDDEDDHHHHHSGKRRYKYRVRRRSHRSRNPTLSEVGGLPPVKTPGPGEPG